MVWFFAIVGLAVTVPGMLVLAALGIVLLSLPFLAIFAACVIVLGLFSLLLLWPIAVLFEPLIALALAIIIARHFLAPRPRRQP
jgi:hypothetical protein